MRSQHEKSFKDSFRTRVSLLRYVAPTRPRYMYTDRKLGITRREARRRRQRRVVFRGSHGSASTWIMPVPVRPTRTCPWNSRSRVRLDASLRSEYSSRLQSRFGRNFVGQILTLLFPRKKCLVLTSVRFISVPKRRSVIICPFTRQHAFLILDIFLLTLIAVVRQSWRDIHWRFIWLFGNWSKF